MDGIEEGAGGNVGVEADEANGAMIITSESITMIAGMYFFIYPPNI